MLFQHYISTVTTLQFCCFNTTVLLLQHYSSAVTTLKFCCYNTTILLLQHYSSAVTTLQFCCYNTTGRPSLSSQSKSVFIKSKCTLYFTDMRFRTIATKFDDQLRHICLSVPIDELRFPLEGFFCKFDAEC